MSHPPRRAWRGEWRWEWRGWSLCLETRWWQFPVQLGAGWLDEHEAVMWLDVGDPGGDPIVNISTPPFMPVPGSWLERFVTWLDQR